MKTLKTILIGLTLILGFTACGDDEPSCKTCTATQEIFQNGELFGTQSIAGAEYCDEALEQVEGQEITTEQMIGGITQTSTTTYTCE